jgi:hypothetical protein
MDSLRSLLVQNQNNLDRLRSRARYFTVTLAKTETDFHRQYGPYAEFWDEWHEQTELMYDDLRSDIAATSGFVTELRDFIICSDAAPRSRKSKVATIRLVEMNELAKEALACQRDMLHMADVHIAEHKEFTDRLLLVETIDSLGED